MELLVTMALIATIASTGVVALRHYHRAQALRAAQRTVASELRQVQQRSMAESYPNAYGVRFTKGTSAWSTVRLNTKTGTCAVVTTHTLEGGVTISQSGTAFAAAVGSAACVNASPGASSANVVTFFYPSGTADAGSVVLTSQANDSLRTVSVSKLTGRVTAE